MCNYWRTIGVLAAAGALLGASPVEARPVAVHVGGGYGVHVGGYGYYHPGYYHYSTYHPVVPAYNHYRYNYYNWGYPGYYYGGLYGGLYSQPYVNYNLNITPPPPATVYMPPVASSYQSFYPPTTSFAPQPPPAVGQPAQDPNTMLVNVRVPEANAQVMIDGTPTSRQGISRQFISPPLTPGKRYSYEIEAKWTENGKQVSQTRKVIVQAGQTIGVDFTQPPAAGEEVIAKP